MIQVRAEVVNNAEAVANAVLAGLGMVYEACPGRVNLICNNSAADGNPTWSPATGVVLTHVEGDYPEKFAYQLGHELTHALFIDRWPCDQLVQHEAIAEYSTYLLMRDHGYRAQSKTYACAHIHDRHGQTLSRVIAGHWIALREWNMSEHTEGVQNLPRPLTREMFYPMVWHLGKQIAELYGMDVFKQALADTHESRISHPAWENLAWGNGGDVIGHHAG